MNFGGGLTGKPNMDAKDLLRRPLHGIYGPAVADGVEMGERRAPRRTGKLAGGFRGVVHKGFPGDGEIRNIVRYHPFQFGVRTRPVKGYWGAAKRKMKKTAKAGLPKAAREVEKNWAR